MKRNLYLIMLVLHWCTMAMGQKLEVDTFYMAVNDRTASVDPRYDANGDGCALIKVRLPRYGASFVGTVIAQSYSQSEYMVYMKKGEKRLTIKMEGYSPADVEFGRWGVRQVEPLSTYILEMHVPDQGGRFVDDGMSFFTLTVIPGNASILIDDELKSLDDEGIYMERLPRGEHSYKINAKGYKERESRFTLGTTALNLTERLELAQATVNVQCETKDADLYVNNAPKGRGTWKGNLAPGNYLFEARKDGYTAQRKSVTLVENEEYYIDLDALIASVGQLEVSCKPITAEVWIDGQRRGNSPDLFKGLAVGSHRVEIRKEGYESLTTTVIIRDGETTPLSGSLKVVQGGATNPSTSTTASSDIQSYKTCPDDHHPHMIDLGLPSGTKWACCNVGASKPEEYGDYYAWGETEVQTNNQYDWNSYKHGHRGDCHNIGEDIAGTEYDVAHVKWGGSWRMPTMEQQYELLENCTQKWTQQNGVNGILVTGSNGNSVFLPAAGGRWEGKLHIEEPGGAYWSSSLWISNDNTALVLGFNPARWGRSATARADGRTVRAVSSLLPVASSTSVMSLSTGSGPQVERFTVNGVTFAMVRVEGGTFTMGATSEQGSEAEDVEKPAHEVTLSPYSIGETEVTQELWEAVMGSNPSHFKGSKHPVEMVSWDDCREFIRKLNAATGKSFRLPTEAEWEYAARGGNRSRGYKYSGSNTIGEVAWYTDNSGSTTHNVATKQSNELGLYDMSGNVGEWCSDWYGKDYYSSSAQTDPKGPGSGSFRVFRGGSWTHYARCCRSSFRCIIVLDDLCYYLGLRLALSE